MTVQGIDFAKIDFTTNVMKFIEQQDLHGLLEPGAPVMDVAGFLRTPQPFLQHLCRTVSPLLSEIEATKYFHNSIIDGPPQIEVPRELQGLADLFEVLLGEDEIDAVIQDYFNKVADIMQQSADSVFARSSEGAELGRRLRDARALDSSSWGMEEPGHDDSSKDVIAQFEFMLDEMPGIWNPGVTSQALKFLVTQLFKTGLGGAITPLIERIIEVARASGDWEVLFFIATKLPEARLGGSEARLYERLMTAADMTKNTHLLWSIIGEMVKAGWREEAIEFLKPLIRGLIRFKGSLSFICESLFTLAIDMTRVGLIKGLQLPVLNEGIIIEDYTETFSI